MKNVVVIVLLLLNVTHCWAQGARQKTTVKNVLGQQNLRHNHNKTKIYRDVGPFHNGRARVAYKGKYGFVDRKGREVIKCKYDAVYDFEQTRTEVRLNNKVGVIDTNGKEIIPCQYDYISSKCCYAPGKDDYTNDLFVDSGREKGLYSESGKLVAPCIYNELFNFNEGLAVAALNSLYGAINAKGSVVIPFKYKKMHRSFVDGLVAACISGGDYGLWGIIDSTGVVVVPFKYQSVNMLSEGLAAVKLNNRWGYVNAKGQLVTDCVFQDAERFKNGFAMVKLNSRWGFINTRGELKIPCVYHESYFDFNESGLVTLKDSMGNYGVVDSDNKIVIPFRYVSIGQFANDVAIVETKAVVSKVGTVEAREGRSGLINLKGEEVIPCTHIGLQRIEGGFMDNNYEAFDSAGKKMRAPKIKWFCKSCTGKYCKVDCFREGLAAVCNQKGEWGYIDIKGNEVIPCSFKNAVFFNGGRAIVEDRSKWFFIDRKGKRIFPMVFDEIESLFKEGVAVAKLNGKYGAVDTQGHIILPFIYNHLGKFADGLAPMALDSVSGFINRSGVLKFKSTYTPPPFSEGLSFIYDTLMVYAPDTVRISMYSEIENNFIIDTNGTILGKYNYGQHSDFYDGLAAVLYNKNVGFINKKGKVVVPIQYDFATSFKNGTAAVSFRGSYFFRCGIIDKKGRWVIPCKYEDLSNFSDDGIACAKMNGKYGFINRSGRWVVPNIYDDYNGMPDGKDGLIPVKKGGIWGYINKSGKRILWFKYQKAQIRN